MKPDSKAKVTTATMPAETKPPGRFKMPAAGPWLWAIIALIIIIAAGGYYLYRHHQDEQKTKSAAEPYALTYKDLTNYHLPGYQSGAGLSVSMPSQFKVPPGPTPLGAQLQAQFSQTVSQTKDKTVVTTTIGNLAVASVYSPSPPDAGYLKLLASNIAKSSGPNYESSVKSIKDFVAAGLPFNYTPSFSAAQVFKSANIAANAWAMNFTASAKQGKTLVPEPPLDGEAILAIGKNGYYYYFVDAVNYNWTGNQAFWQQIVDSLKIDQ